MIYRKSIFERDGKYKFLHLTIDDRPFTSLVESAESESIFDMSCTVIQVFPTTKAKNPSEQDYLAERNRLSNRAGSSASRRLTNCRLQFFPELPICEQGQA
jgi:hypothetical protein